VPQVHRKPSDDFLPLCLGDLINFLTSNPTAICLQTHNSPNQSKIPGVYSLPPLCPVSLFEDKPLTYPCSLGHTLLPTLYIFLCFCSVLCLSLSFDLICIFIRGTEPQTTADCVCTSRYKLLIKKNNSVDRGLKKCCKLLRGRVVVKTRIQLFPSRSDTATSPC